MDRFLLPAGLLGLLRLLGPLHRLPVLVGLGLFRFRGELCVLPAGDKALGALGYSVHLTLLPHGDLQFFRLGNVGIVLNGAHHRQGGIDPLGLQPLDLLLGSAPPQRLLVGLLLAFLLHQFLVRLGILGLKVLPFLRCQLASQLHLLLDLPELVIPVLPLGIHLGLYSSCLSVLLQRGIQPFIQVFALGGVVASLLLQIPLGLKFDVFHVGAQVSNGQKIHSHHLSQKHRVFYGNIGIPTVVLKT